MRFRAAWQARTLRARMILLFAIFALGPLLVTNVVGYLQTRRYLERQALVNVQNVADLQASETLAFLRNKRDLIPSIVAGNEHLFGLVRMLGGQLAENPEMVNDLKRHLEAKVADVPAAKEFTVLGRTGLVLASSEPSRRPGLDLSRSRCFAEGGAGPTITGFEYGSAAPDLLVAGPIRDRDGESLGVFCARYTFDRQQELLQAHERNNQAILYLLDKERRVVCGSSFAAGSAPMGGRIEPRGSQSLGETAWAGRFRLSSGEEALAAFTPIDEVGWGVLVAMPKRTAFATLENLKWRAVALGTVLAFLVAAAVVNAAGRLTRPLKRMMDAAKRTAAGARGESVPLEGPEELFELGRAFNQMSRSLKESHELLEQRIVERTRELQQSREFVELLLDSIDQAVVVVDRELRVVKMNHTAVRLFGPAVLGSLCAEICGRDGHCSDCAVRRVLESGIPDSVERSQRIGGAQEILNMDYFPVKNVDGQVDAVVEIGRIVTGERRIQAQMVHHEKMAAFGLLAAGIAHEIGNPLAAILSQLRMTRAVPEPERVAQTLGIVEREVGRISQLLRELVTFTRRRRDEVVKVCPNQVVEDVVRLLGHDPRARNVKIEQHVPPGMPGVRAKEDHLIQVLLNLGINALDAMPDGGTMSFEVAADGADTVIRVRDSGCGIPEEARARLFEPFFTTKAPGRGTGLGLFVSKGIAEQLGGKLTLEKTGPDGTVFELRLPKAQPTLVEATA